MKEQDERMAVQGPAGPQGKQGEQGKTGLSIPVRRAFVFLFALCLLLNGVNFLWSARQQHGYEASLQASHAAHQRADQLMVDKLCLTFGELGALKPPAGDPAKNPARGYDQELHATLIQLGTDVGCSS